MHLDCFTEFEMVFNTSFPLQLRNMLVFHGFDTVKAIAELTEDDIIHIEMHARKVLHKMLDKNEYEFYYPPAYLHKYQAYNIPIGHRKIINLLKTHLQNKFNKTDKSTFTNKCTYMDKSTMTENLESNITKKRGILRKSFKTITKLAVTRNYS